jgi:hypothetical protein
MQNLAFMSAAEIYQQIKALCDELRMRSNSELNISIWSYSDEDLHFDFANGRYGSNEIKVSGKDVWALVDELKRRHNFDLAQKNLLLGPPIVENAVAAMAPVIPPRTDLDDEIPF